MFDSIRNNKRIVQIFLALITLPFAFFGVDSYVRNSGAGNDAAVVGDTKITVQQFDQAMRERREQMQRSLGESFKPEIMNSPEVKMGVLNSLIDQRLLLLEADKNRLMTSNDVLRDAISRIPALQEDGKFSLARYEMVLRAQGMSEAQFEAQMRQDLTLQQLVGAVGESAFVSKTQADGLLKLQSEERQFSVFMVSPDQFAGQVKIDGAAAQKFYDENKSRFEIAEQVKAEYVVLSPDALVDQVTVDEEEVKSRYEKDKRRNEQPEQRRASHILIAINADTDKAKARAKAEEVLKEVLKSPARFVELAKKYSEDTGSGQKGGDLGFFAYGDMVPQFSETVFKQKEGEVSGLVETQFGFHIIKLTGIKPGKIRSLAEVRGEIEGELKLAAAQRKFAEAAEEFSRIVYEQEGSLQPVADKFKLKILQSGLIGRSVDPKGGLLANEKILGDLFSQDGLKYKRNSEAVEVSPRTLVAARVIEHVPASTIPFDSAKADIEKLLRAQEGAALAKASGEKTLAELSKGGEDQLAWSPVKTVSRMQSRQMLPPAAVQAVFKADARKLPVYAGAEIGGGYVLYKIVKVDVPERFDENKRKAFQAQYGAIMAQEDLSSYLAGLRERYKIKINQTKLELKEAQ